MSLIQIAFDEVDWKIFTQLVLICVRNRNRFHRMDVGCQAVTESRGGLPY